MRVQRTRSSALPPRSPLTRRPLGSIKNSINSLYQVARLLIILEIVRDGAERMRQERVALSREPNKVLKADPAKRGRRLGILRGRIARLAA
jgi:hypothetical protein